MGGGQPEAGRFHVDLASPAALIYNLLCSLKPYANAPCPAVTPPTVRRPLLLLLFLCVVLRRVASRVESAFPSMPFSISTSFSTFLHLPSALGWTRCCCYCCCCCCSCCYCCGVPSFSGASVDAPPPCPLPSPGDPFSAVARAGACENFLFNYSVTFDLLLLSLFVAAVFPLYSCGCCCV